MTVDRASANAQALGRRVLALIAEADELLGRCAALDDADGTQVDRVRQDVLLVRHEAVQAERGLDRLVTTGEEVASREVAIHELLRSARPATAAPQAPRLPRYRPIPADERRAPEQRSTR